jgi:hypothetical protein
MNYSGTITLNLAEGSVRAEARTRSRPQDAAHPGPNGTAAADLKSAGTRPLCAGSVVFLPAQIPPERWLLVPPHSDGWYTRLNRYGSAGSQVSNDPTRVISRVRSATDTPFSCSPRGSFFDHSPFSSLPHSLACLSTLRGGILSIAQRFVDEVSRTRLTSFSYSVRCVLTDAVCFGHSVTSYGSCSSVRCTRAGLWARSPLGHKHYAHG